MSSPLLSAVETTLSLVNRVRPGTLTGAGLDEAVAAIRPARKSVLIASPFISAEVGALLARTTEESGVGERRLLTALNAAAVLDGYLDPEGIQAFVEADFEVRSLLNLHAKVLLVDQTWGLVGSGNLTRAGLDGGNAELGVVLDQRQARSARRNHFDAWWRDAEPLDDVPRELPNG